MNKIQKNIITKLGTLRSFSEKLNSFLKWNNISTDYILKSTVIAVLFLVFRYPINKFLIDGAVEIPFNYIETTDKYDNYLFYIIAVILLLISVYRALKEFTVSTKRLWLLTLINLIYLTIYRNTNSEFWKLNGLNSIPEIKFFDLLLEYWFLTACIFIRNQYVTTKKQNESVDSFYEDDIQSFRSLDLFNRKIISEQLFTRIKNTNNSKAFAIGVTGVWGSGKSVFLDFIKTHLESSQNWIVIDFNPWRNESPQGIVKDFFAQLTDELTPYSEEISNQLSTYFKSLVQLEKSVLKDLVEFSSTIFSDSNSLKTKYEAIDSSIKKLDKKLIIFIDDIDRLDSSEVFEVLKIVRNTAGFGNTFFILAYDKNYVNHFVSARNGNNGASYLEKIVQYEIVLPPIDPNIIRSELTEKLVSKIDKNQADKLRAVLSYDSYNLMKFICNLRDVIRFSNNFYFNYTSVTVLDSIVMEEFFLLELIKYKYFNDYENIYNNRSLYFSDSVLDLGEQVHANALILKPDADLPTGNYTNLNVEVVTLLKLLFSLERRNDVSFDIIEYNSIRRKSNFYKYFTYQVFSNDISFTEIEKILINSPTEDQIEKSFGHLAIRQDPVKIINRLKEFNSVEKVNKINLVKCILRVIKVYPSNFDNSIRAFELIISDSIRDQSLNFDDLIKAISEETEFIRYFTKIYLTFLNNFVKNAILTPQYFEKLVDLVTENLDFFADNHKDLKRDDFLNFNILLMSLKSRNTLKWNKIQSRYKQLIKLTLNNTKAFLESTIAKETNSYHYFINGNLRLIYGSEKQAKEELLDTVDSSFMQEYGDFYRINELTEFNRSEYIYYFRELLQELTTEEEDNQQRLKQIIIAYDRKLSFIKDQIMNYGPLTNTCAFTNLVNKLPMHYTIITGLESTNVKDILTHVKQRITEILPAELQKERIVQEFNTTGKIIIEGNEILNIISIQPPEISINNNYEIF